MKRVPVCLMPIVAVALVACGGGDHISDEAGPCVVRYDEPVLTISSARSAAGAASIPALSLSQFSLDGSRVDVDGLTVVSSNVRVVAGALECTLPCGFGIEPGTYAFAASAPGYAASAVTVAARYGSFSGNCPASYDDGSRVAVTLSPL